MVFFPVADYRNRSRGSLMQDTQTDSMGEITQEVVDTLIELMTDVIGKHAVDIVLKKCSACEEIAGRDLVFHFADETEKLVGVKGAHAVLRQVGRDLAKRVALTVPEDKWDQALKESLNHFGFAKNIINGKCEASINDCVFYTILEERNLNPTEHSVCWAGWGFIEGFMKLMKGTKGIQWTTRDLTNKSCKFSYFYKDKEE